ncbi:MAG: hypothetical protein ABI743_08360 [bacterium]
MAPATPEIDQPISRQMLNKVPEITLYFWIIKVLCTTVGETGADYLIGALKWGLTTTSWVMGGILVVVLLFQFRARQYIPGLYWLAVVFLSIVGTLITDNLTDNMGVALELSTAVFGIALAVTFGIWYARERTLSIHSISTTPREAFYWLAVLVTFALGTAGGDLLAERIQLGYLVSGLIFAGAIALIGVLRLTGKMDAMLAFWLAYILTRPLGASIGDYLSQSPKYGGLGLGTTVTSLIFLAVILVLVVFLSLTGKDVVHDKPAPLNVQV